MIDFLMFEENEENETLELLYDLKHDLGKYVQLPFMMLPQDAEEYDIRDALRVGLFETRSVNNQVKTAKDIWHFFEEALNNQLDSQSFKLIKDAVIEVFELEKYLNDKSRIDISVVKSCFAQLNNNILNVIDKYKDR
jgi:hypothetical protein